MVGDQEPSVIVYPTKVIFNALIAKEEAFFVLTHPVDKGETDTFLPPRSKVNDSPTMIADETAFLLGLDMIHC